MLGTQDDWESYHPQLLDVPSTVVLRTDDSVLLDYIIFTVRLTTSRSSLSILSVPH
jgi:hypothetical protein